MHAGRRKLAPSRGGNATLGEAGSGGAPRARHRCELSVRPRDPAGAEVAEMADTAEFEDGAEGGGGEEAAAARGGRRPRRR